MPKYEVSVLIDNPPFLSDRFTTRIDLLTGNPFYESQWGKLFAILPPEVAEDIAREIWRECFTRVVLKPPNEYDIWDPIHNARNKISSMDCLLTGGDGPVCHCFNKDGRMCGAFAYNCVFIEEDEQNQVMRVPNLVAGVKQPRNENAHRFNMYGGRSRENRTRMMVCDKHEKILDERSGNQTLNDVDYVNKVLTKWGWGERNGYPIKLDVDRDDIEYSGTLERKLEKDRTKNHGFTFRWRRPTHDYEVSYSTSRYHLNPDGTRRYDFQQSVLRDFNGYDHNHPIQIN
jgi:hypothetical protein